MTGLYRSQSSMTKLRQGLMIVSLSQTLNLKQAFERKKKQNRYD